MKKKLKFMKKIRGNKAFALVELVVAVGLFSIVVLPIMASMVASLKTNLKSKKQMAATEVAQNVLEGIRDKTYADVYGSLTSVNSGLTGMGQFAVFDGGAYTTSANGLLITNGSAGSLSSVSFNAPTTLPEKMKIGSTNCITSDLVDNKELSISLNQIYAQAARDCLNSTTCSSYGIAPAELGLVASDAQYGPKALITCGVVDNVPSAINEKLGFMVFTNVDRLQYHYDVVVQFVPMFKEGIVSPNAAINQRYYTYEVQAYVYELTPDMVGQPTRMSGQPLCSMTTCIKNR